MDGQSPYDVYALPMEQPSGRRPCGCEQALSGPACNITDITSITHITNITIDITNTRIAY